MPAVGEKRRSWAKLQATNNKLTHSKLNIRILPISRAVAGWEENSLAVGHVYIVKKKKKSVGGDTHKNKASLMVAAQIMDQIRRCTDNGQSCLIRDLNCPEPPEHLCWFCFLLFCFFLETFNQILITAHTGKAGAILCFCLNATRIFSPRLVFLAEFTEEKHFF